MLKMRLILLKSDTFDIEVQILFVCLLFVFVCLFLLSLFVSKKMFGIMQRNCV